METLDKIKNSLRKEIENVFKEICENSFINVEEYNKLNYSNHIFYIKERQEIISDAYYNRTLPNYLVHHIK